MPHILDYLGRASGPCVVSPSRSVYKKQGEGQGGCNSKCLQPEIEWSEVRVHAVPVDAGGVQNSLLLREFIEQCEEPVYRLLPMGATHCKEKCCCEESRMFLNMAGGFL
jgi:hypothetical protein